MVNPTDIFRKGKERHTKTDRIDAQLIAKELKDGCLDSIHVTDKRREELRSLFRRRNDLVKNYRNWLDDLDFEFQDARLTMESKLRQFRFIDQEIREVYSTITIIRQMLQRKSNI
ncbi:IS110 family transposase [Nonlabens sp. Ci31]|uniref:IS110 family transposase n=1 Tax=Nonlabens sp. Ci31 TaxID=2608253 RepID=UPI001463133A|nr:transposase [Nonlabens sp. Ci31]QJP33328.1 IS110 family transposase [Nonlabens sp. Ci31]